jgi:lipopolysaccharide export system permease protein
MVQNSDELVLMLKDGIRYSETTGDGSYNPRQRFTRYRFKEAEQKFDLTGFKQQRTDEDLFKSNYAMMNLKQLKYYRDSTEKFSDSVAKTYSNIVVPMIRLYSLNTPVAKVPVKKKLSYKNSLLELVPEKERLTAIIYAQSETRNIREAITLKAAEKKEYNSSIFRAIIEYQRKFTLAISCLILFSIGAPLGAIIRKGGLGLPVVMSILFFLIYHIISTIGEKSARAGTLDPVFGMWIAIIVLAPLGVFLTYKAAIDSAIFDVDYYKQQFLKLIKKKKPA